MQPSIRPLITDQEMRACEQTQQAVWQFSALEIVPHHIFVVASKIGGQVLGAFLENRMIGFTLAFPGVWDGRLYLHSHLAAVLPEYQNRGIGRQLKLAQRGEAVERGVDLIEWTFDPLQPRNAFFNIVRLGVIIRRYIPDLYGTTSSSLDAGLPTDRLVAEWWIRESRVQDILDGQAPRHDGEVTRIRLPANLRDICNRDPQQAREIQSRIRVEFELLFDSGFTVTGFELNPEYAEYLLESSGTI